MVLNESGEDTIFICDACGYSANVECAQPAAPPGARSHDSGDGPQLAQTPNARTIDQVCAQLKTTPDRLIKTLLYRADCGFVAALIRGDRDLNEFKLRGYLGTEQLTMATPEEILQVTGAPVGFSGPVGLPEEVRIVADCEIQAMAEAVVGANRADAHLLGVRVGVDFQPAEYVDLREARHGDPCGKCSRGTLQAHRAIEVGHVFKLGTKYSAALDAIVD